MQLQIKAYPAISQKSQIDTVLTPVFDTVRNNKINSFAQLKNWQQDELITTSYIFQPQKISHRNKEMENGNKTHSLGFSLKDTDNNGHKWARTANSRRGSNPEQINNFITSFEGSKNHNYQNKQSREGRNRIRSIRSKMKKHLVQQVDFQQIQKKLFQKRQCMTRYQYFMEIKNQQKSTEKTNSPARVKLAKNLTEKQKSETVQLELQLSSFHQTVSVRPTPRKKFWLHKSQSRRYSHNTVNNSVAFVEGKALRTIQI